MAKFFKILILIFFIIIVFSKNIISYYYIKKFSRWVERPVKINQIYFEYSGYVEIKDIKILNLNEHYYKNIFQAEKIEITFDLKSLFSDLIIVKSLTIINPEFFIDIKISKEIENSSKEKTIYKDNIGLAEKLNEKKTAKIWPKKDKDINFIIINSTLSGTKAKVKVSSIQQTEKVNLSKMTFSNFGNEKNYKHYKDILKIILFDLYATMNKGDIKETLKKIYNF